jgi:hypothetical protein
MQISGQIFFISPILPILAPLALASFEAAMMQPLSPVNGATPTGFPRKVGWTCCSTEAKKEFISKNKAWKSFGG